MRRLLLRAARLCSNARMEHTGTSVIASNVPEMAPFLGMVALRIPAALTVLQILAVDLGTDLLPALGPGLTEAVVAMSGYLLVWRTQGVGLRELRALAPSLLHHRAPAALQAVQTRASTVTFAQNVAAQMGALLACRSDFRPLWQVLRRPNRRLWVGFAGGPVGAILVLVPPLAQAFGTAPFPTAWLEPMLPAPLAVLTADSLHKLASGRWSHGQP